MGTSVPLSSRRVNPTPTVGRPDTVRRTRRWPSGTVRT